MLAKLESLLGFHLFFRWWPFPFPEPHPESQIAFCPLELTHSQLLRVLLLTLTVLRSIGQVFCRRMSLNLFLLFFSDVFLMTILESWIKGCVPLTTSSPGCGVAYHVTSHCDANLDRLIKVGFPGLSTGKSLLSPLHVPCCLETRAPGSCITG